MLYKFVIHCFLELKISRYYQANYLKNLFTTVFQVCVDKTKWHRLYYCCNVCLWNIELLIMEKICIFYFIKLHVLVSRFSYTHSFGGNTFGKQNKNGKAANDIRLHNILDEIQSLKYGIVSQLLLLHLECITKVKKSWI